ncbi:MAG: hypothetical protein M0Z94_12990 [Dehalococcoidales bacterium]|nr:hypothetical protein [Dehalococcoidales bacterium]
MSEYDVEETEEYDIMVYLERLESLREEMEELEVSSLAELDAKIRELHEEIDHQEG